MKYYIFWLFYKNIYVYCVYCLDFSQMHNLVIIFHVIDPKSLNYYKQELFKALLKGYSKNTKHKKNNIFIFFMIN